MGPLWDFDGGYDFDWSDMYHSHKYFTSYKELVLGTKPSIHSGTQYQVPGFFSDLFSQPEFVSDYRSRWETVRDAVYDAWHVTDRYAAAMTLAAQRDNEQWPIGYTLQTEKARLHEWIINRVNYLDKVIAGY